MTADTVKHTPGPWFVEDPMGAEIGLSIVQYGLETYEWEFIAMVCQSDASDERMGRQWFISPEEQMANATLIAAAPDLLEALEGLLDAYSKPDERLCCDGRECGCMGSTVHQMAEHYARAVVARAEGRS